MTIISNVKNALLHGNITGQKHIITANNNYAKIINFSKFAKLQTIIFSNIKMPLPKGRLARGLLITQLQK